MSDDPRFVDLSDGWLLADEEWHHAQTNGHSEHAGERIRAAFESAREFAAVDEVSAEALLGTRDDTILPADGILLMYGDGGAGKTTLSLDAACHLADGREWLGLPVGRPVRSLVIENEGPRGKFRQIIGTKLEALNGSAAGDRITILRDPWSRFTVADAGLREDVAAIIAEREIDVILLGPLATVGMVGGGTPDEISAFEKLLRELRRLLERPVAFWIIHHENKSGDVSGAWERVPDTLVHVQAAGNGHTRFVFRKARWSSDFHGKSLDLVWSEGRTFVVADEPEGRDYWADVLELFRESDEWRTVDEVRKATGIGTTSVRSVLAELVRRGDLMNEKGPHGRHPSSNCYRLRGATILSLVPEPRPEAPGDDGFEF